MSKASETLLELFKAILKYLPSLLAYIAGKKIQEDKHKDATIKIQKKQLKSSTNRPTNDELTDILRKGEF